VLAAEQRAADDEHRQRVGALAQQPQGGVLQRSVAAQLAGGVQALGQAQTGGSRRLGQDLGVVDVVAAAEGQAAGGQDELRRATALDRQGGDAHGAAPGHGHRLGPHERHPQVVGALLHRLALRAGVAPAGQGVADGRHPAHIGEAPIDPLRGKVGPRRREVEVEAHARPCGRRVCLCASGAPLGQ
jgi:hypothetical protein